MPRRSEPIEWGRDTRRVPALLGMVGIPVLGGVLGAVLFHGLTLIA